MHFIFITLNTPFHSNAWYKWQLQSIIMIHVPCDFCILNLLLHFQIAQSLFLSDFDSALQEVHVLDTMTAKLRFCMQLAERLKCHFLIQIETHQSTVFYCFSSLQLIPVSQWCLSITLITKQSFKSNKIKKHSTVTPNLIPDKLVMHQMLPQDEMVHGSLWFITAQACLLHPSCSHGVEEKAVKGGTLSNAFGNEKGRRQISYFFTFWRPYSHLLYFSSLEEGRKWYVEV